MIPKQIEYNESAFTFNYTVNGSCPNKVKFNTDVSWLNIVNSEAPNNPIVVSATTNLSSERTGHVITYYEDKSCGEKTIEVVQKANTVNLCSSLNYIPGTTALTANATRYTANFTTSEGNITSVSATKKGGDIVPTSVSSGTTGTNTTLQFEFEENTSTDSKKTYNGIYNVTITSTTAPTTTCSGSVTFEQAEAAIECSCNDFIVSGRSTNIDVSGGTEVVLGTFSKGCITNTPTVRVSEYIPSNGGGWINGLYLTNGSIIANIDSSTSSSARKAKITIEVDENTSTCSSSITITQNGTNCTCDNFAISETPSSIGKNAGTYNVSTITESGSCITNVSASANASWITNLEVIGNDILATVGANTNTNSRSATISVSAKDSTTTCPSKTFTLTQSGTNCTCEVTTEVEGTAYWPADSTSGITVFTYPTNGNCSPVTPNLTLNGSFTSSNSNGSIIIYPSSANTSYTQDVSGTAKLTITCNGTSQSGESSVVNLIQYKRTCNCNIITTSLDWGSGSTEQKQINVASSACTNGGNIEILGSGATHFEWSWDDTNKWFNVQPIGVNNNTDDIIASAKTNITCLDGTSTSKTIELTHSGRNCGCSDFKPIFDCACSSLTLSQTANTLGYNGGTFNIEYHGCEGKEVVFEIPNSASTWLSITNQTDSGVTFSASTNDSSQSRNTTIAMQYGGEICSEESIYIVQYGVDCCSNFSIPPSANLTWDASTITIPYEMSEGLCASKGVNFEIPNSASTWLSITSQTSSSVTFSASTNSAESIRTAVVAVKLGNEECTNKSITLIQDGIDCCSNLVIDSPRTLKWSGDTIVLNFNKGLCASKGIVFEIPNSASTWLSITNQTSSSVTFSASTNSAESARTAVVAVKLGNEECTNKSITLIQDGKTCVCEMLEVVSREIEATSSESSYTIGTYSTNGCAFSNLSVSAYTSSTSLDVANWVKNLNIGNGEITCTFSANGATERKAYFEVTANLNGGICKKDRFMVNQKGVSCNTLVLVESQSLLVWECNATSSRTFTFTGSPNIASAVTSGDDANHFVVTVNEAKNGIIVRPISENQGSTILRTNLVINYGERGVCEEKFELKHNTCGCPTYRLEVCKSYDLELRTTSDIYHVTVIPKINNNKIKITPK